MKPLPKVIGWITVLLSVATGLLAIADQLPPKVAFTIMLCANVLTSLSHSLPGTGGAPPASE